jgi:hypothetical protein
MRLVGLLLAAAAIPACGGNGGESASNTEHAPLVQVPDFHLVDRNSISATYKKKISPRGYLEMVPGFYFTHAN